MDITGVRRVAGSRCIALVGPYLSGKTTLLEAILFRTGGVARQGKISEKSTIGDSSPEARSHGMSVELNAATTQFMGDSYTFIDCPGSIEFAQDARAALAGCDAAIVVCEADDKKGPALQLILKQLDQMGVPRILFINKIDKTDSSPRDVLVWLQPASSKPLILRQLPILKGTTVTGFVDLALERAYVYREHAESQVIEMPADLADSEKSERFAMLEKLADHDNELLEQLLSDMEPPRDRIFADLSRELAEGLITPVLFGSAEHGNGVGRLLKALRHEAPDVSVTAKRLGLAAGGGTVAQVLKTFHTPHGGKLSLSRILRGEVADGAVFHGAKGQDARTAGVFQLMGSTPGKVSKATAGDTVALGRLETVATGETIATVKGQTAQLATVEHAPGVYGMAISVSDRKDEVKLTSAIAKLIEEDPSLRLEHNQDTHEMVLWGQGEMHLRVALERLQSRFGVQVASRRSGVAYRETIRDMVNVRGRHKKQSGGHGQYGDVLLDVRPLSRGEGFAFNESVHGGSVPRNYFSSVEIGSKDALTRGPLGFPVVDVGVTLTDGSYHAVDSSDMAFRMAARLGVSDALAKARPVLLEPILSVEMIIPEEAMAQATGYASGRRGQILGYDARPGWAGWVVLRTLIPEAEISELIVELRSMTAGVGTYLAKFDHMAELSGKAAETIVAQHKKELEKAG